MEKEPREKQRKQFSYSPTSIGMAMATVLSVAFFSLHNQNQFREQYLE